MKTQKYSIKKDGFYGLYFPAGKKAKKSDPAITKSAMILMLGDSPEDTLAKAGAKWFLKHGISVMTMSPEKKDYGHHNYPLERIGAAIRVLQDKGHTNIGIAGLSTTGMVALTAASFYPELSMTIAMSASDFVMEGFYQDNLDGAHERPGDGTESSLSWKGEPLPFLQYAYRHPEYWGKISAESKATGNMVAARSMFDESERRNPVSEEARIKVENIKGHIVFIGAEDDALWDTCKYTRRMVEVLQNTPGSATFDALLYEHGTHFVLPATMLTDLLPVGITAFIALAFQEGRKHPLACKKTREDIDEKLTAILETWKANA